MATESAPVNGIYGTQYGQPAELAASTPSAPAHASSTSMSSTAASTTAANRADPQEIGWYFVEQYYTNLSKSPERIHLFYSKKSQLVAGVEAEKVVPAVGIKAISEKIKSMDIQDCKVRVLNVDSQASFQNIVVQVIGEMSNKSEPHHKFVQTFVLAEQPNGYFVLNDIFRYLNSDEDEIVEDEPEKEEALQEERASPVIPATEPEVEKATETVDNEEAVEKVDTELEEVANAQEEQHLTNGAASQASDEPVPSTQEVTETVQETVEEPLATAEEEPASPEPTRAPTPPKAQTPAPAPAADVPLAKKTWASMVGTKAPALPVVPIATPPASVQPKAQKPTQSSQQSTSQKSTIEPATDSDSSPQSNGWQMADGGKKQKGPQTTAASVGNTLAYIKNVTEKVDAFLLKETLEKFGKLKYYDVSRGRNCAFVEFETSTGYIAAVAANPHEIGSETIYVEERRPKPAAYGGSANTNFSRGGSTTGRGRGGNMQARTGSQSGAQFPKDAGRGNLPQQRGGKSGNVTPRGGKGQAQAV